MDDVVHVPFADGASPSACRRVACTHSIRSGRVDLHAKPVVRPARGALVHEDALRTHAPLYAQILTR